MREGNIRLRQKLLEMPGDIRDVVDSVIDIVYLSPAGKLSFNGLSHHLVVVFHNISLDGHAVLRGFLKHAHVPDSDQAHMQRSRDRSGRQRQDVYILPQFFNLLLMCHSKTLFLINDQKSQIFESHVL